MSLRALWLCIVLLIGLGVAADVPFVFDKNTSGLANYTSSQLERAHLSSNDLAGVPTVTQADDNEIMAFPVTGGGSISEGKVDKNVGELKKALNSRVEPDNPAIHREAVVLAAKYPGDHAINQIDSIYSYLKSGDGSRKGWSYVPDPRGIDYFMYANESLAIGKDAGCAGAGDCDDFAILMSALVESVGGATRIIMVHNNTSGGHAYTEVFLGQLNAQNSQVEGIINWLMQKYNTDKIYTSVETDTRNVWLNLDWGPDKNGNTHPGGPLYQGDKCIVLCIRDRYGLTPLRVPDKEVIATGNNNYGDRIADKAEYPDGFPSDANIATTTTLEFLQATGIVTYIPNYLSRGVPAWQYDVAPDHRMWFQGPDENLVRVS